MGRKDRDLEKIKASLTDLSRAARSLVDGEKLLVREPSTETAGRMTDILITVGQMGDPDWKPRGQGCDFNRVRLLVLMVGIPGSGKTWARDRLFPGAHIICPDDHIGYTDDDPWTPAAARRAWGIAHGMLSEALGNGGPDITVFDATMTTAKKRKRYVRSAERAGVVPVAAFMDTPFETCLLRNAERWTSRRVPAATMGSMAGRLEKPSTEEGFGFVIHIAEGRVTREGDDPPQHADAIYKRATDLVFDKGRRT